MRWSLAVSAAILIIIPVFSTPIPRMMLGKRGLFETTMTSVNTTPDQLAAMVTNALTDDPQPCSHVKSFFEELAAGETAGGVTTIGDRAVAGARKMLGLQKAGVAGLVQMVNEVKDGTLSNSSTIALIQALSNSARTVASLKTYKFLLDTQSLLTNLTNTVNQQNTTELQPLVEGVAQIQPTLQSMEHTIDQFGADFSVQNLANQNADLETVLSLVKDGTTSIQNLKKLNNNNVQSINPLLDASIGAMDSLSAAATEAITLANAPPDIPPSQFNGKKGTACS